MPLLRALVLCLALVACGNGGAGSDEPGAASDTAGDESDDPGAAIVTDVVDGDTVVVRVQGQDERVRLIGIDTPESVDPRRPVECFGKEAATRTRALLPEGTEVRLVRDVEPRDRYGRLLAYVYRSDDDLFVNLTLVEEGYAAVATYPPNVAHTPAFVRAAAAARHAGRGLWRACPEVPSGT